MVLPLDVWQQVFSNLNLRDLRICRLVCKLWNSAIQSDSRECRFLWYQLYQRDFDVLVGNFRFNQETHYKNFYKSLFLFSCHKVLGPLKKKAEASLKKARIAGASRNEIDKNYGDAIKTLETALKIQIQQKGDTTALNAVIADLKQKLWIPRILQEASLYLPSEEEVAEFKQVIELYQDQDDPFSCWEEYIKASEKKELPTHVLYLTAALYEYQRDFITAANHYLELIENHPQPLPCLKKAAAFVQKASDPLAYPHFLEKLDREKLLQIQQTTSDAELDTWILHKDVVRMVFEEWLYQLSCHSPQTQAPTCFICFNVEEADVGKWLEETLVPDLEIAGIKPIFCFRELSQGQDLDNFQELARSADLVIIACTPDLKKKYEERKESPFGLAQEIRMIKGRYHDPDKANTIFPIYLKGTRKEALPTAYFEPILGTKFTYLDKSTEASIFSYYSSVFELFGSMRKVPQEQSRRMKKEFFKKVNLDQLLKGAADLEQLKRWREGRVSQHGRMIESIQERVSVNAQTPRSFVNNSSQPNILTTAGFDKVPLNLPTQNHPKARLYHLKAPKPEKIASAKEAILKELGKDYTYKGNREKFEEEITTKPYLLKNKAGKILQLIEGQETRTVENRVVHQIKVSQETSYLFQSAVTVGGNFNITGTHATIVMNITVPPPPQTLNPSSQANVSENPQKILEEKLSNPADTENLPLTDSDLGTIPTEVRGFFKATQTCMKNGDWEKAVGHFCNALGSGTAPSLCYRVVIELIPHCNPPQLQKLIDHLPPLLKISPHHPQDQTALALALGNWFFQLLSPKGEDTIPLLSEEGFRLAKESLHYYAKALQIAAKQAPDTLSSIHRKASQLFMEVLKTLTQDFEKDLDSARRGGERELPRFQAHLQRLSRLKSFCISEQEQDHLQHLYEQASHVLAHIDLDKKEKYGLSLINQGLSACKTAPLPLTTERYHQALATFRDAFQNPTSSVRELQHQTTEAFQRLFQTLLDDALALLGPAPCTYDIRALDSYGREEPCPYSGLAFMILIQNAQHTAYFATLVQILELQIASFGETSTNHPPFTCLGPKNPSGLHLDRSPLQYIDKSLSIDVKYALIRTPPAMAQHQLTDIQEPQDLGQALLKTTSLSTTDPSLFTTYQTAVTTFLSSPTSTLRTTPALPAPITTTADLATPHSSASTDSTSSIILLRREARALAFFQVRLQDFQDRWKQPFKDSPETLNLKTHYVELLNHLLSDLALFCGLTCTNTLDMVDELVRRGVFTPESGTLLKESLSFIYNVRRRFHLLYKEQNEATFGPEAPSSDVLSQQEIDTLEKIYHLILVPLYTTLSQTIDTQQLPSKLDLPHTAFVHALIHQTLTPSWLRHFVKHLLTIQAPDDLHQHYYTSLSQNQVDETLRDTYLEVLESHQAFLLLEKLAPIPTPAGLRASFRDSQHRLEQQLIQMTTPFPTTPEVAVTSASWDQPRYLKTEVLQQAFGDSFNLKKSYPHSLHNVCRVTGPGYDLHIKQKPSHPLMEYAIHNLTSRIAGELTPPTQLVRFDVKTQGTEKSYPVLISQTIPGQSLKDTQDLDKRSWTWHLLCAILTRPGDGRLSNYVVHDRKLYCIDNDIAFVEPVVKHSFSFSRQVQLAVAPFCLYPLETPLDREVLQAFAALDATAILDAWMDDIIAQEKAYTALFSEAQRKKLHTEDPNNTFTPTILLREGTIATLNLQFLRVQNRISQNSTLTSGGLLHELLSLQEETIGPFVFKKYQHAMSVPLNERVQQATDKYGPSMTTAKYNQASLGEIPTFEEIEKKRSYGPEKARQEFFSCLIMKLPTGTLKIDNESDKTTFQVNFQTLEKDPSRQEWTLKALIGWYEQLAPPPHFVTINHCAALTSSTLKRFLHNELKHLDLKYCNQIIDADVVKIHNRCPKLKKLSLSGCSQITSITRGFRNPELVFSELEYLDLNHCSQLKTVNFQALALKTLEAKRNPLLKSIKINKFEIKITNINAGICLNVEEIRSVVFGASKWAEYIGDVGTEPPFPAEIIQILESPCPIWPGKKVKKTHLLTLIPQTVNGKPLTLQLLGELVKKPLKGHATEFRSLSLGDYQDPTAPASHWALMSCDVIPGSRRQSYKGFYTDQQALVKSLAEKSQIPYKVPTLLDVCVSLFMHHLQTGERLHGDDPWTYTRCQEKYDENWQLVAGGFSSGGLHVYSHYYDNNCLGVSVLLKF